MWAADCRSAAGFTIWPIDYQSQPKHRSMQVMSAAGKNGSPERLANKELEQIEEVDPGPLAGIAIAEKELLNQACRSRMPGKLMSSCIRSTPSGAVQLARSARYLECTSRATNLHTTWPSRQSAACDLSWAGEKQLYQLRLLGTA